MYGMALRGIFWGKYLSEALVELAKDAVFVEHFALISVLIVVRDSLPQIPGEFPVHHVLLNLLKLEEPCHKRSD